MRMIYGRVGTAGLVDHHKSALDAIAAGDAAGLSDAIRLDIREGMTLIGQAFRSEAESAPVRTRRRSGSG
jgi:DNA-binding GntR family transcriptional regulator